MCEDEIAKARMGLSDRNSAPRSTRALIFRRQTSMERFCETTLLPLYDLHSAIVRVSLFNSCGAVATPMAGTLAMSISASVGFKYFARCQISRIVKFAKDS